MHENTISALTVAVISNDDTGHKESRESGFEMLIAGSYDRQLSFWKVSLTSDGTAVAKFDRAFSASDISPVSDIGESFDFNDAILAVVYSPSTNSIFTGGNAGIIRKWAFWGVRALEAEYKGPDAHEDAITCFAVDGYFLFSGSSDCTVRIWETHRGTLLKVV